MKIRRTTQAFELEVRFAELLASGPETIAAHLKQRPRYPPYDFDEKQERQLLEKGELIKLALAGSSSSGVLVAELFAGAEPGAAIRLAALSNRRLASYDAHLPSSLFGGSDKAIFGWIVDAPQSELATLFSNDAIDDSFLVSVLSRKDEYKSLPDDKLRQIVLALSENARMATPLESDGETEYHYNRVFDAAWHLAALVEPTTQWAYALGALYTMILPHGDAKAAALAAKRWMGTNPAAEATDAASSGDLSRKQLLRKQLAKLSVGSMFLGRFIPDTTGTAELIASDDLAFRAAAYSFGRPTALQVEKALDSELVIAFASLQENDWVWSHADCRQALEARSSDLRGSARSWGQAYDRNESRHRASNPDWFAEPSDEERPVEQLDQRNAEELAREALVSRISTLQFAKALEKSDSRTLAVNQNEEIASNALQLRADLFGPYDAGHIDELEMTQKLRDRFLSLAMLDATTASLHSAATLKTAMAALDTAKKTFRLSIGILIVALLTLLFR